METVRRTRTVWLSVLFWLSLAGLIGAMAWGFFSYRGLEDRLAEMSRAVVPGEMDIEVTEPGTLTIFYEDPTADGTFVVQSSGSTTLAALPAELTVTGPSGERVAVAPYERDLRFDYDGRVLTAIAVIDATTAGTYNVEATGDVPAFAQVSVGHVVDVGLVANVVGVVGLFLVSVLGMAVAVVVIVAKRGRVASSDEAERPLVGV
jgi:hypothetical protein